MKSSSHILVNPLSLLFSILVICPGQILAQTSHSAPRAHAKAQLHVPWKLLQERLRAVANERGADGSGVATPLQNQLIRVPYDGEEITWSLSSGALTSSVVVDSVAMGPDGATVAVSKAHVHVVLNSLSVDQVIERNVGGVVVRVHLQASCGPIEIDQAAATAQARFGFDWTGGSPSAAISTLDLGWAPGSWTFNSFACTGPSGLDQLVHDGLVSYFSEPTSLKPYVESYVAANLQSSIDSVLVKLREPFVVGVSDVPGMGSMLTGVGAVVSSRNAAPAITIAVGDLSPVATGVIGDLTLRTDAKVLALPALPVPSASVLKALSSSQPSLVGGVDVLEFIVGTRLAAQSSYFRIDLQKVDAFHALMHNRIAQLFAWQDLWHYGSDAPFYLNLSNPRALTLKRSGSSGLSSTMPLSTIIQSYRDSKWWNYVVTKGTGAAVVSLGVTRGTLSYTTTISSLKISSDYGPEYAKKYNKKNAKLPDSVVSKAIVGRQAALSGTMKWPDIDLAEAGKYRGSSFTWLNDKTFTLGFAAVK